MYGHINSNIHIYRIVLLLVLIESVNQFRKNGMPSMKRKIDVFVKLVRLRLTSAFTLLIFAVRHEMFSKPLTFNPSTTQYCSKA